MKRKCMRKLGKLSLVLVLVLGMAFSAAGCGNSGGSAEQKEEKKTEEKKESSEKKSKEKDLTIDLLLSRPITISAISDGVTRLLKSILKKKKNVSHRNKLKLSGRQQKLLQRRQLKQDRIFSLSTTIKMS